MSYVSLVVDRLVEHAESGASPDDLAAEARDVCAEFWLEALGSPEGLEALVEELRRWCAVAAGHYALRRDHLVRAGCHREAEAAARQARAMDRAGRAVAEVSARPLAGNRALDGAAGRRVRTSPG